MSAYFPVFFGMEVQARLDLEMQRLLGNLFGINPQFIRGCMVGSTHTDDEVEVLIRGYMVGSTHTDDEVEVHLELTTPVIRLRVHELNDIIGAAERAVGVQRPT